MENRVEIRQKSKEYIINILHSKGSFWSYESNQKNIDDDSLIEKALLYLDFEDMDKLFVCYSKRKIKDVWKNRLLIQGNFYNKINWLLAVMVFNIRKPDRYLEKYGSRKQIKTKSDRKHIRSIR